VRRVAIFFAVWRNPGFDPSSVRVGQWIQILISADPLPLTGEYGSLYTLRRVAILFFAVWGIPGFDPSSVRIGLWIQILISSDPLPLTVEYGTLYSLHCAKGCDFVFCSVGEIRV
jgi:hypothetical protein